MLNFLSLAAFLCWQDIQERFAGSVLGAMWVFIWPIIQLFIYLIIFGKLMGARLGMSSNVLAYGFYIASGLVCWTCFANSLGKISRCLVDKRDIIRKAPTNLALFPTAVCLGELLPFAAGFILLFAADLCAGWHPDFGWICLTAVGLYTLIVLAYGLGLFFACLAVFWRDICEICAICLQMAFWFTPIVYLRSILPDWLQNLVWINPMTAVTAIYQQCFVLGGAPAWPQILYSLLFAHASLALGLWTLRHWQKDIRDAL